MKACLLQFHVVMNKWMDPSAVKANQPGEQRAPGHWPLVTDSPYQQLAVRVDTQLYMKYKSTGTPCTHTQKFYQWKALARGCNNGTTWFTLPPRAHQWEVRGQGDSVRLLCTKRLGSLSKHTTMHSKISCDFYVYWIMVSSMRVINGFKFRFQCIKGQTIKVRICILHNKITVNHLSIWQRKQIICLMRWVAKPVFL